MTRRLLPASLGGLACAICCTLPILTATGVLSGGAVAAAVEGWLDAAAAVLVAAAALLLALPTWRGRRAKCAGGCDGECTCQPAVSEPGTNRQH
jgi:mercuric ion transport protein